MMTSYDDCGLSILEERAGSAAHFLDTWCLRDRQLRLGSLRRTVRGGAWMRRLLRPHQESSPLLPRFLPASNHQRRMESVTQPLHKRSDEFKTKRYSEVREVFQDAFDDLTDFGLHILRALLGVPKFHKLEKDLAEWQSDKTKASKNTTRAAETLVKLQKPDIKEKLHNYYVAIEPAVEFRRVKELKSRTWHGSEQEKLDSIMSRYPEPPNLPTSEQLGTDWGDKAQEVLLTINTFDRASGLKPLLGQPYALFVGTAVVVHLALFVESGIQWKDTQELDEAQALFDAVVWSAVLHLVVALLLLRLWRGKYYLHERNVSSGSRQHMEVGLLYRLLFAVQVLAASAGLIVAAMVAFPPEKARSRVALYILIGSSCASLGSVVILSVVARVWSSWLALPWDCWPTRVPR